MDYINKLEKYLGNKYDSIIVIKDDLSNPDLELSEWYTADDYTLYVMTNDARNIDCVGKFTSKAAICSAQSHIARA